MTQELSWGFHCYNETSRQKGGFTSFTSLYHTQTYLMANHHNEKERLSRGVIRIKLLLGSRIGYVLKIFSKSVWQVGKKCASQNDERPVALILFLSLFYSSCPKSNTSCLLNPEFQI